MDSRNEDEAEFPDNLGREDPNVVVELHSVIHHDLVQRRGTKRDNTEHSANGSGKRKISLDWTRHDIPNASPFVSWLRNFDWAATPLGPMKDWSASLRLQFMSIVVQPHHRALIWGDSETMIYNEAAISLFGTYHGKAMGQHISIFGDFYARAAPSIHLAREEGRSSSVTNWQISMDRSNDLPDEETFWSYDLAPVFNSEGTIDGVLLTARETTQVVVGERRMATLLDIARETAGCDDLEGVWGGMTKSFQKNSEDVPFSILYSVEKSENEEEGYAPDQQDGKKGNKDTICHLAGVVGFTEDEIPNTLHTGSDHDDDSEMSEIVRKMEESRDSHLLTLEKGTLPKWLNRGFQGRAGGKACRRVMAMPIPPMGGAGLAGFLILGLTERRPYDDGYRLFLRLLSDRLLNSTAQVSLPKDMRDAQVAAEEAALRHATLSQQLALKSQEADRNEAKVSRMAQQAPVGIVVLDVDFNPVDINETARLIVGSPDDSDGSWDDMIHDEDREMVWQELQECRKSRVTRTFQYRLKKPWTSFQDGVEINGSTWINAMLFAEVEDGELVGITCWCMDISLQKWTEESQARRLEEAMELKRQRENFIDMTSHEMRNPLSAILQSADGVIAYIKEARRLSSGGINLQPAIVEAIMEAAQTINLCGLHQKRIVDDILTMSKLDSNMIALSPDRVRPLKLAKQALKMYESEIEAANIDAAVCVDQSFTNMNVDEVILDPSRLLQVLINLITNAIKFTKDEPKEIKRIRVCLSVSSTRPEMDASHEIRYIPPKARDDSSRIPIARRSSSASVEPGGSAIWLQFAIEDSGRGLSEDELNLLFNRFRQASAKTFSSYGGSGLGLFISRELTELQGGQIGVSSRRGSGSCFVFFVRALQVQEGTHDLSRTSSRSLSDDLIASPVLPQTQTFESRPTAQRLASAISPAKTNGTAINEELQTASKPTKLHVLLVEDNIINQKVIATQLRRLGNTVHVANHGLEALHHLQHTTSAAGRPRDPSLPPNPDKPASAEESDDAPFPIDVVLLDQEMPVMDGIETIKRIREMERNGHLGGHVPVIAVTANARGEQVTNAIECGCDRVVTKPFRIPDLVQQMQELLHELSTKQDV